MPAFMTHMVFSPKCQKKSNRHKSQPLSVQIFREKHSECTGIDILQTITVTFDQWVCRLTFHEQQCFHALSNVYNKPDAITLVENFEVLDLTKIIMIFSLLVEDSSNSSTVKPFFPQGLQSYYNSLLRCMYKTRKKHHIIRKFNTPQVPWTVWTTCQPHLAPSGSYKYVLLHWFKILQNFHNIHVTTKCLYM